MWFPSEMQQRWSIGYTSTRKKGTLQNLKLHSSYLTIASTSSDVLRLRILYKFFMLSLKKCEVAYFRVIVTINFLQPHDEFPSRLREILKALNKETTKMCKLKLIRMA